MWSIFPAVSGDRQLKAVLSTGSGLICHLAPLVLALSTSQRSSISFAEFLKVYSAECSQIAVESLSMTASLNSRFVHQDVATHKRTCKKRDWTRLFTSDLITQATVTARRRWNIGHFAHSNIMSHSTPTCLHSKFWSGKKCNTAPVAQSCCRFITALTASNKDANCICTCWHGQLHSS